MDAERRCFDGRLTLVGEGDACRVSYLGYPLCLSPSETRILLSALDGEAVPAAVPTDNTAAVLVGRINRKAAAIGGRKLLISARGQGYRVNPEL